MIPGAVILSLEEHVSDVGWIAGTVLLAFLSVFAIKFLMRSIVGASQREGMRAVARWWRR